MLIICENSSHTIYFNLFFIIVYFNADGKDTNHPGVDVSTNLEFIRENHLKPISHSVEFVDIIFPVYRRTKGGCLNKPYHLSTEA